MRVLRLFCVMPLAFYTLCAAPRGASSQDLARVVINEVMHDPVTEEPEWIELFNASGVTVNLSGWTVEDADSSKRRLIIAAAALLESTHYLCLAEDDVAFALAFTSAPCPVLKPAGGWPRLNNSGDCVVLRDAGGRVVDRITFEQSWGGEDGRSLERIHPDWPSDEPGTWSSCSPPATSTPCAVNSIFFGSPAPKASVSARPDPFETETEISYALTIPTAIVKLEIYDIRGRLVRRLIDQEARGSSGTITWDGRDDEGHVLEMGIYILYLEGIHAERGALEKAKATVTLARGLR